MTIRITWKNHLCLEAHLRVTHLDQILVDGYYRNGRITDYYLSMEGVETIQLTHNPALDGPWNKAGATVFGECPTHEGYVLDWWHSSGKVPTWEPLGSENIRISFEYVAFHMKPSDLQLRVFGRLKTK